MFKYNIHSVNYIWATKALSVYKIVVLYILNTSIEIELDSKMKPTIRWNWTPKFFKVKIKFQICCHGLDV